MIAPKGLNELIELLNEYSVDFKLINPNFDIEVLPANFNSKIDFGFYHVSPDFNGSIEGIENSIFLVKTKISTNNTQIIVNNPQLTHYQLLNQYEVKEPHTIHPTAIISKDAIIGENVNIGPYSIIEECTIGDDVNIRSHVNIRKNVNIKERSYIDSNSCIGPKGVVWVWDELGNRINQPQLGGVVINENCYIGTDVTIVKGSLSEDTVIGKNSVISHGTKIGHGAIVGEFVHMANNVSLAGNTNIGNRCYLGSASIVPSNVRIPDNCVLGAGAMVNKNFEEEYLTLVGVPAKILYKENFNRKGKGIPIPHKK